MICMYMMKMQLNIILIYQCMLSNLLSDKFMSQEINISDEIETIKSEILNGLGFNTPPPNPRFITNQSIPEAVISKMFYGNIQNSIYNELDSKEQFVVTEVAKELLCHHSHCVIVRFAQKFHDSNVLSINIWLKSKPITISKPSSISVFNFKTNKKNSKQTVSNHSLQPTWHNAELNAIDAIKVDKEGQFYIDEYFKLNCKNCKISLAEEDRPFIVVSLKKKKSSRKLRSTQACKGSEECCRSSITINFKDLGWESWILAPKTYESYYCSGTCKENSNTNLPHFQLLKSNNNKGKCCVPKSMSSLAILYVGSEGIIKKDLPNMIVDECWCI
ncbi:growth/differentiation factor 8 [Hydra vulgaris]|uniref:growth/differentiation factor 8 n=1 Tax=Hydra vulgaris TaxID=6087 RepID=UPI001F5E54E4|nr:growth/differentiation factor 8-like [Hydra vulgaris]